MGKRANGEGTIFRRKDGRWVGETFVLLPHGVRDRRTVYGRTRADVHAKITELNRQSQSGVINPTRFTVAEYLSRWLAEVAKRGVRPKTFQSYEVYVRLHLVPEIGALRLDRLSVPDVRRLINRKLDSGASLSNVRKMHAVLRSALEQAVRDDLLTRNVAKLVKVPMPPARVIDPYSPEEARELLAAAEGDRLYALWAVAMGLGLRKGEALGLRWEDVDLDEGWLRVVQAVQRVDGSLRFVEPKTARSRRTIPLPPVCVRALREHRVRQDAERLELGPYWQDFGLVFASAVGTPIDPDNVNREFDKLCARSGVRRVRVHDLRHTCATLLLAQGVPARVVMEILGHSQISITLNTYSHVAPALQHEAMAKMDDVLSPVAVKAAVTRGNK